MLIQTVIPDEEKDTDGINKEQFAKLYKDAAANSSMLSRMSSRASPEKKTLSSIKLSVSRCPQPVLSSSLTSPSLPGKL